MKYSEYREFQLSPTATPCPNCSTLLQKFNHNDPNSEIKTHYICPNNDCNFVGAIDVSQVLILRKQLNEDLVKLADFTVDKISGFAPVKMYFTENCFGFTPNTWAWNFGDGTLETSTRNNIAHEYTSPGVYSVIMQITHPTEGSHQVVKNNLITIKDYESLSIDFSADITSGYDSLIVNFQDTSTGSEITGWEWDFGDGSPKSYLQNPQHQYTRVGNFDVTLTIYNSRLETQTITKSNYINIVYQIPRVQFTANRLVGFDPMEVQFTLDSDDYIENIQWIFGDGQFSTEENPSHIYTTPGLYSVKVIATNPSGSGELTKDNYITINEYVGPPVADFTYEILTGLDSTPISVKFNSNSTGSGIKEYFWQSSNGDTSYQQNPTLSFSEYGSYDISLTVKDWRDIIHTITKNIILDIEAPTASFVIENLPHNGIQFTNTSTGDFLTYYWQFGDGGVSTEKDPYYLYSDSNLYSVILEVRNNKSISTFMMDVIPTE